MSKDSEIISRSITEPAVFAQIFERHAAVVGGYTRRRLGLDAVDDVLSETFLVAFRKRASFDTDADSARPWLLGIATRLIHRYRRVEDRQWRAGTHEPIHTPSHETQSDARLDATVAIRNLAPHIAALSQKERDVLLLHAWADLTYEQIADSLGIPTGTVRSRLNRVRKKLTLRGSEPVVSVTWTAKEDTNAVIG